MGYPRDPETVYGGNNDEDGSTKVEVSETTVGGHPRVGVAWGGSTGHRGSSFVFPEGNGREENSVAVSTLLSTGEVDSRRSTGN